MKPLQKNNQHKDNESLPTADTGNASNPSSGNIEEASNNKQLLNEKANTYLREAGNIEDLPDDKDQQDMDEKYRDA